MVGGIHRPNSPQLQARTTRANIVWEQTLQRRATTVIEPFFLEPQSDNTFYVNNGSGRTGVLALDTLDQELENYDPSDWVTTYLDNVRSVTFAEERHLRRFYFQVTTFDDFVSLIRSLLPITRWRVTASIILSPDDFQPTSAQMAALHQLVRENAEKTREPTSFLRLFVKIGFDLWELTPNSFARFQQDVKQQLRPTPTRSRKRTRTP